jgi:hypothetical protein
MSTYFLWARYEKAVLYTYTELNAAVKLVKIAQLSWLMTLRRCDENKSLELAMLRCGWGVVMELRHGARL